MSRRDEFYTGATFKHVVGGEEHIRNAVDATYSSRTVPGSLNYDAGWAYGDPDEAIVKDSVQPGVSLDPFVNKRYGDKKQLPFRGPRRAGPLPYPETAQEAHEGEREKYWSQSQ